MYKILIIDDDDYCSELYSINVSRMGYQPYVAHTLSEGISSLRNNSPNLVLLDVNLPDGSGLKIIEDIKNSISSPEIIILTSDSDVNAAELALNSGAWVYLNKTCSHEVFKLNIERALQYHSEKLKKNRDIVVDNVGLIGSSPGFLKSLDFIRLAVYSNANVLIQGETGTGKEQFARAIHNNSNRKERPFIVIDCASLPDNLVESMLFGHEKGSFTGANSTREGLLKQANGGTVFLDEIGELPLSIQKSFLRALQERRFRPVGSNLEVTSNFRLICATNRNLNSMVKEDKFRSDLLYRINSMEVCLPPLRERKEDIRSLVRFYSSRFSNQLNIPEKNIDEGFLETLEKYSWPGNIRELVNVTESAIAKAGDSSTIFETHLPLKVRIEKVKSQLPIRCEADHENSETFTIETAPNLKDYCNEVKERHERKYIMKLKKLTGNDFQKVCDIANISNSRLYQLLKKHNISTF